jgi:hypothetical protein
MPNIANYIQRPAAFEPEAISAMADAYELALKTFPTPPSQNVREMIATRIIWLAETGERNPQKLCDSGLAAVNGRVAENRNDPKVSVLQY